MAIRWHMGFSGDEDKRLVGQALQQYPLAFALSVADMEATYFLEKEGRRPVTPPKKGSRDYARKTAE